MGSGASKKDETKSKKNKNNQSSKYNSADNLSTRASTANSQRSARISPANSQRSARASTANSQRSTKSNRYQQKNTTSDHEEIDADENRESPNYSFDVPPISHTAVKETYRGSSDDDDDDDDDERDNNQPVNANNVIIFGNANNRDEDQLSVVEESDDDNQAQVNAGRNSISARSATPQQHIHSPQQHIHSPQQHIHSPKQKGYCNQCAHCKQKLNTSVVRKSSPPPPWIVKMDTEMETHIDMDKYDEEAMVQQRRSKNIPHSYPSHLKTRTTSNLASQSNKYVVLTSVNDGNRPFSRTRTPYRNHETLERRENVFCKPYTRTLFAD